MPFTPAHTAIVLPFCRMRYLSATGLIVGSVAPDFEYFFKMSVNSAHSHTVFGIFYFNIPVVVLLSFVFHLQVKQSLLQNSPVIIQRKLQDLMQLDFQGYFRKNWGIFLLSAFFGSASHILWDSFTHGDGYFAKTLWFYEGTFVPFDGVNYPLFYALQHISTAIGLTILVLFITFRRSEPAATVYRPTLRYWSTFISVVLISMILRFGFFPADLDLGNFVVSMISSACLAAILCGFIRGNPDAITTQ